MNENSFSQDFALCLTRHQTSLYGFIYSLVEDRHAAEDILQQTNLTLLQKSDEFTPGSDFLAWACTVARYKVRRAQRDVARQRQRLSEGVLEQVARQFETHLPRLDARRHALRGCLDKLPERDRRLIEKRYEPGSSVQRLAEEIGRTAAAVSQKLYRIRIRLTDCVRATLAREG